MFTQGPCPACGKMFASRARKMFCSLQCYLHSPLGKANRLKAVAAGRAKASHGVTPDADGLYTHTCLECAKVTKHKLQTKTKRKFCSRSCFFAYMAKRFDRWIANPETLEALPQAYDEFLNNEELPCLVKGCDWHGKKLCMHMNSAHGVTAVEFKEMVGFNTTTGVISAPFRKAQENMDRPWINSSGLKRYREEGHTPPPNSFGRLSLQGRERRKKLSVIRSEHDVLPDRTCRGCGKMFTPLTGLSFQVMYCTVECRSEDYARKSSARVIPATCVVCSKPFKANYHQSQRMKKGQPVVCSMSCRQILNGRAPKPKKEIT